MDYKITPYVNKVFNADILSYLNVDSEGDIVSAETWKALWGNILNFTQQIDVHMTELLSPNGVVTLLIADHNRFIEEHALILADYNTLKQKFAVLDDTIAEANANVQQVLQAAQTAHAAATALGTEFIHYGDTPPTNPYTKLWARKTDATSLPATLADVEKVAARSVEKVKGNTMTDQVYAVDIWGNPIALEVDELNLFKNGHYYQAIPRRQSNGNIMTNTPIDDLDCANKEYVDNAIANAGGGSVDLTDYVKKINIFDGRTGGIILTTKSFGIDYNNGGYLMIVPADTTDIVNRAKRKPIDAQGLDYAVKVGLTTNTETLTDEEKAQAQSWLGITELIGDIETLLGGI